MLFQYISSIGLVNVVSRCYTGGETSHSTQDERDR